MFCAFNITTDAVFQTIESRIRITKKLRIPFIVDGLTLEIFLPGDYTNGVNIQKISGMSLGNISGGNFKKRITIDKYGNRKLHLQFFNLNKEIFLDYGFIFSSRVKPRRNKFPSRFPINLTTRKKHYKHLRFTGKVQYGNKRVINLVRFLTSKHNELYKAVLEIFFWVRQNVHHDPNQAYDDGLTTYLNRKGNEKGILNLILMLLRTAKIPCRVVKGISIDKKFVYRLKQENLEFRYPRGYYKWIEIFFPTRAWVPFDINASYFFVPDNIIRLGVGNDTEEIKDLQKLSNGILLKSNDNFFVESMNINKYINSLYSQNNLFNNIALPPGDDSRFINSLNKDVKINTLYFGRYLPHKNVNSYPIFIYINNVKKQTKYSTLVKYKITEKTNYAQQVDLQKHLFLDHIALPIYFSGIYPAKVRVEIYKDDKNKPGKLYARSYYRILTESKNGINIHKFYFERQKWPFLEKGKYWIVLKTSKKGQIYWQGIFGNSFATANDTRKNDGNYWDTYCNVDFMFEIWGNYIKRPEK